MCEALRRLMKDEIEETLDKATKEASEIALEQGRTQMQKETSAALSKMGMSVENIASAVNASVDQVLGWI